MSKRRRISERGPGKKRRENRQTKENFRERSRERTKENRKTKENFREVQETKKGK